MTTELLPGAEVARLRAEVATLRAEMKIMRQAMSTELQQLAQTIVQDITAEVKGYTTALAACVHRCTVTSSDTCPSDRLHS